MREFVLAFAGSFCAGVLFNVKGRKLFLAGLSGLLGWVVYSWALGMTGGSIVSIFAGAVAVGVFSETAARLFKSPATVFSIPGIFPIVPGIAAYETIQLLFSDKLQSAGEKIVETLSGAGAIAFGILLVTAGFRIFLRRDMPANRK
jgi:uncharacterized membrane protein YjjB (DUF3815 family)